MNYFLHGGRLGDAIYSLYAVKKAGGGIYQMCLYHAPYSWNLKMLRSLAPLIEIQKYVKQFKIVKIPEKWIKPHNIEFAHIGEESIVTHDLIYADTVKNPECFPELVPGTWPGNVHLAKRYCHPWGYVWNPEEKWLDAPKMNNAPDIVCHIPLRRSVRSQYQWSYILENLSRKFNVMMIGGDDLVEWVGHLKGAVPYKPENHLITSSLINSAKVFFGVASSCNVIAEALKKHRFVELADDCFNTYPYGETGRMIRNWSDDRIISEIYQLANE